MRRAGWWVSSFPVALRIARCRWPWDPVHCLPPKGPVSQPPSAWHCGLESPAGCCPSECGGMGRTRNLLINIPVLLWHSLCKKTGEQKSNMLESLYLWRLLFSTHSFFSQLDWNFPKSMSFYLWNGPTRPCAWGLDVGHQPLGCVNEVQGAQGRDSINIWRSRWCNWRGGWRRWLEVGIPTAMMFSPFGSRGFLCWWSGGWKVSSNNAMHRTDVTAGHP